MSADDVKHYRYIPGAPPPREIKTTFVIHGSDHPFGEDDVWFIREYSGEANKMAQIIKNNGWRVVDVYQRKHYWRN